MTKLATMCAPLLLILGWQCTHLSAGSARIDQQRLQQLIAQLGSDSFAEREQAARELEAAGPLALDALRSALKHPDSEISGRAIHLVAVLEEQALTSKMLAGKKVRLNLKEVSILDAVSELAKQSDYRVDIAGNRPALGERKITLDTGEVTFWEALHQLCKKGGLTERNLSPIKPCLTVMARGAFSRVMFNRICSRELRSC